MTGTKKKQSVFRLSVPIFIELFLQMLVGNVDQMMLSQFSQQSVAAIGNANQIMNVVVIALNVFSAASTILITQYIGAENRKKISEVASVSLLCITGISVLLTAAVTVFAGPVFSAMNLKGQVAAEAAQYLVIVGAGILAQGLYLNIAAILRSFGMVKEVMLASVLMNVINIGGNAVLIGGLVGFPRLGIAGAAISTDLSKLIGLLLAVLLLQKRTDVRPGMRWLRPFPTDALKRLLYIGLPSGGEELSYNVSQICIMSFINLFGTAVMTTKVYCSMLANVSYVYCIALSQATQIVLGYKIGEGRRDELTGPVRRSVLISIAVAETITLLLFWQSDAVLGLFTSDPAVLKLGHSILFIELFLELGRAVNITMVRSLVAAGDIKTPVTAGLVCMWGVSVLFSWLFGVVLGWGLAGIWVAMTMDEVIRGAVFLIRWKSGAWRRKSLI
ncbi:MAG: MATE family efflux transporter [Oscillospiraceae bacterium]|nr:MATE family efflux transporter [Oscillospiraceae bacterium]